VIVFSDNEPNILHQITSIKDTNKLSKLTTTKIWIATSENSLIVWKKLLSISFLSISRNLLTQNHRTTKQTNNHIITKQQHHNMQPKSKPIKNKYSRKTKPLTCNWSPKSQKEKEKKYMCISKIERESNVLSQVKKSNLKYKTVNYKWHTHFLEHLVCICKIERESSKWFIYYFLSLQLCY